MPLTEPRPVRTTVPATRIRRATPEDSGFLAEVILRAGRSHLQAGYWDIAVPEEDDRLDLIEMMTVLDSRSSCHFSGFHIATVNGQPAAAATGYDPFDPGFVDAGRVLAEGFDFIQWSTEQIADTYQRLVPFVECSPPFKQGDWVVEWVAVLPRFRGLGLGEQVVRAVLRSGRRRKHRRSQVATFIGNDSAIRLYRRLGFEVAGENRHPTFEALVGAPGMVWLSRKLQRHSPLDGL